MNTGEISTVSRFIGLGSKTDRPSAFGVAACSLGVVQDMGANHSW